MFDVCVILEDDTYCYLVEYYNLIVKSPLVRLDPRVVSRWNVSSLYRTVFLSITDAKMF